ncbi:hypothetical protein MTO96_016308, partial [Rhipicephalus appendiculatus]
PEGRRLPTGSSWSAYRSFLSLDPSGTLPEMCAAVEAVVKDPAVNGADKKDNMLTASFEAPQLFIDDGPTAGLRAGRRGQGHVRD